MTSLLLWPERPALSFLALWLISSVFLWAAREPMLQVVRSVSKSLESGLRAVARWCSETASALSENNRTVLLAANELELGGKMSRELLRIDGCFSAKLEEYGTLHRKLDDLTNKLDADYASCSSSPPAVPGWAGAVEAVSVIPTEADPAVMKVLSGIRESVEEAEKKALRTYRDDTAQRHRILSRMRSKWKEVQGLAQRMKRSVEKALQTSSKLDRYVDEYQKILKDRESAARNLTHTAAKPFVISLIVLTIALGGAFINFQLIALPMSELVPAAARLGGIPVSTVSALVLVLMEAAVGIFAMDMLGITELFPKLAAIAPSRRRIILALSLGGLFFLACVESSLAILREQIVEADAALKLALAGSAAGAGRSSEAIGAATASQIPMIGQAILGFILPWILAMVAVPLEMLLDSGRHVMAALSAALLQTAGHLVRVVAHAAGAMTTALPNVYDVYISIPLRIERGLRSTNPSHLARRAAQATTAERRIGDAGVA